MIDVKRIMDELPRKVRRTKAQMVGELIAEGKSTAEAKHISDAAHKRTYKAWLRDFEDQHGPGLADAARRTLKRIGVLS
ncbi:MULTISPECIES: hypothetical protein [unclassified Ruegeria]|uniref:hypothetical protein n=1 Tax=unclassified Ruegeria TaxID=2625375 RepID=UPI00149251A9|nr:MULTISPECIES: hypothetical protein [unclassified Ruegeria]NOD87900.1 hypothetical protein [Ruegeria sp. HKCCD4318]NOE14270.1 hypothetical protein [Ruegeria sp. HKCCD4318-2]NOG08373.1 hypothetical protein [Ruegeria sp. HKCCD4315]